MAQPRRTSSAKSEGSNSTAKCTANVVVFKRLTNKQSELHSCWLGVMANFVVLKKRDTLEVHISMCWCLCMQIRRIAQVQSCCGVFPLLQSLTVTPKSHWRPLSSTSLRLLPFTAALSRSGTVQTSTFTSAWRGCLSEI